MLGQQRVVNAPNRLINGGLVYDNGACKSLMSRTRRRRGFSLQNVIIMACGECFDVVLISRRVFQFSHISHAHAQTVRFSEGSITPDASRRDVASCGLLRNVAAKTLQHATQRIRCERTFTVVITSPTACFYRSTLC